MFCLVYITLQVLTCRIKLEMVTDISINLKGPFLKIVTHNIGNFISKTQNKHIFFKLIAYSFTEQDTFFQEQRTKKFLFRNTKQRAPQYTPQFKREHLY